MTCAHRGDDARIVHRQARSLLGAGHRVTLISPDPGVSARSLDPEGLVRTLIPRAVGRRRMVAWWAVRRALSPLRPGADVILIHDPELVPIVTIGRRQQAVFVWDVHEDFVAVARGTVWMPRPLRGVLSATVTVAERFASLRCQIMIAEEGYLERFASAPVVPNTTWVAGAPRPYHDPPRVVYVGRVSYDRGVREMIGIGEELHRRGGPRLVVVGPADDECESLIADAHRRGVLDWRGSLPNPEALEVVHGSLLGLSLLHDTDNHRVSRPTKVMEYLACGTPVVSTPLPYAVDFIERAGSGIVTDNWEGQAVVDEVVAHVLAYASSPALRRTQGEAGWRFVHDHASWNVDGPRFVATLESFVSESR